MTTRSRWIAIAVLVAAASCTSDDQASSPGTTAPATTAPTTTAPATTSTSRAPEPEPTIDGTVSWTGPFEATLPNGWSVRDCEGDRTNVCVYDGAELVGDIELLAGYPLAEGEQASAPGDVARTWAADFVDHFRDDRAQGCAAFTFAADEVAEATVLGQPGTRSSFTLRAPDGTPVERVINHYVVLDGAMAIVNTDAYARQGGCLGPSEYDPSFTPEGLAQLEPYLDALVAAAGPPATDGSR